jgi:hypothetical protein
MHLKIQDDKVELDGVDITNHVAGLELNMIPGGATVALTLASVTVDVNVEANLLKLEKKNHTRFESLNGTTKFVRAG